MKNMILSALSVWTILAVFSFAKGGEKSENLIVMSHEVKDFDTWKATFENGAAARSKAGIQVNGVYRSVDNPNVVTVISSVSDIETAKKFISNPELKSGMEKAGVISKPDVKIIQRAL